MTQIKTPEVSTNKNSSISFDKISFYMILLLGFLVPIFFLPIFNIAIDISKGVFISTFATISFFLWLVARLKDGRFIFPKSIILFAGSLIPAATLLSSVFSEATGVSFAGLGYEIGTFTSILVFFILMFLSSIFFQKIERISKFYFALLTSAIIAFIYQISRFVFLSFGIPFAQIFVGLPDNLIGKWADMAIFFGLTAILSIVTLELISLGKKFKLFLYTTLIFSMIVLIIVNMKLVWFIVGLFALIIFVYTISFGKRINSNTGERKIPAVPFTVLLISLFFILAGGVVGDFIYSTVNIPQEVIRPLWSQTFEVAKWSLIENPIFGEGPNRFSNIWLMFKPAEVNSTVIWNMNFNVGVGLIPSFMITMGLVGILAWLAFITVFIYMGIKAIFSLRVASVSHYVVLSSFIASLYLWTMLVFYVPNITILFLAFIITGIFIASLVQANIVENYNFSFLDDPRVGFVSVLVLILLIISSITGGYLLFQKFLSVGYFQKGVMAFRVERDIDKAEQSIVRAIKLSQSDLYYRTLAEVNLSKIGSVLSNSGVSSETVRTEFTSISKTAIQNAVTATEIDKTNYLNWVTLAKVYGTLMQFGATQGFYESAKQSYEKALELNPNSPSILLSQARLEITAGNKDEAKKYIARALNKKNNYTDAIFLLSQIQADNGDLKDAIASAEVASLVSPNNIGVFFQLGILRYKNKDYSGAVAAFERAVELNYNYSNARYFLGLSYSKIGETDKAIDQFEQILKLNPGNVNVINILKNLKNGRSPLLDIDSVDSLPIKEE